MPRTQEQFEEIRNNRKKTILDTALELFANNGYAATSISQIAKKAGISKGLMYNYFESKEDLLKTIIISLIDELAEYLDSNHDNKTSEEEALQFIDKCFEYIMNKTEELKLFYQLALQSEALTSISDKAMYRRILHQRNLLLPFLEKRHKEKPNLVLLNFLSTLNGMAFQYLFSPKSYSDELMFEYKEYFKDAFIRVSKK